MNDVEKRKDSEDVMEGKEDRVLGEVKGEGEEGQNAGRR